MGQHRFEEEIRKQLKNRELNPSANSWNTLSERLEKEDKKSRSYYWIAGIAASFITGILILGLTFNSKDIEGKPAIVDTPVESNEKENEDNVLDILKKNPTPPDTNNSQIAAEEVEEAGAKKVKNANPAMVFADNSNQEVAATEDVQEVQEHVKLKVDPAETEILPQRLEEIIAEVSKEANSNGDLTEAEVDALLYQAAAEISMERDREGLSGKVDATALLMEVEMELDQGFREKVFDILKEGYLKARTAVANRNF